jgi:predicted unusual protein kinase regulating ubiquinone biosynthesis (AarF/ABC1/UbiB family)
MANPGQKPANLRFLRAYFFTYRILLRYLFLFTLSKILGRDRTAERWEKAHAKTARQIKENILALKGLFIKMGQMISIMTHFLPKAITQELEGLQDAVPPAPYEAIEARFREEFHQSPKTFFAEFDTTPIASASLGQVHRAVAKDGTILAVKVQYPDIEAIVVSDLKTLKRIFGLLHLLFPQYGLKKTYVEVREVILNELDFKNEGGNLELLQKNLAGEKGIIFPKVFWEYSTSRVLSLEFMEGVKVSNLEGLKSLGLEPRDVAKKIVHAYCRQIFIDGVYHADPHPGNFLVQAEKGEVEVYYPPAEADPEAVGEVKLEKRMLPKIVMMDFGAVARISEPMRKGIARFIEGVIKRDNQIISRAMKDMGFIAKNQDEEVFDKIVNFFYERLKDVKIEELKNFKLDRVQHLDDILEFRKLDISFKDLFQSFNVPKDWALLERTLILLVGLTTHLDPKFDPLTIIIPYAEQFVLGKDRTFADLIMETVKEVALSYLKLPTELQRTLHRLNQGELEIGQKEARKNSARLGRAVDRLTYAVLTLGALGISYALQKDGVPNYQWGYYLGGFFGALLGINMIRRK